MTERLYYTDSYVREFPARVIARSEDALTVYLDRTAFYPTSGGQPFDTGCIGDSAVIDVEDEGERIGHRLAAPLTAGAEVRCSVDWSRRFDHMQQHSGQHVLSAVFDSLFGLHTVSFHLGAESSTIDLEGGMVDAERLRDAERRANEVVFENRPVSILFESAEAARDLRKPSEREGTLRVIAIDGLDRSACGGTHVRATGEIGPILLRKLDRVRQTTRVEFLCGSRAVERARSDYETLSRTARLFSATLEETPSLVETLIESARASEKARRKLEIELAEYEGRALYEATTPGSDGIRRASRNIASGSLENVRALAQSYTSQAKAVFVASLAEPPSVLLAASQDSAVDAGKVLKAALVESGGRGGGNARLAQGSVANAATLETVLTKLAQPGSNLTGD